MKFALSAAVAKTLRRPTIVELIPRFGLSASEYRSVFADHDPGDEDRGVRNYCRWVCSLGGYNRRPCSLAPNHFGPHDGVMVALGSWQ